MNPSVRISVPVRGTCPAGHDVTYELPTEVAAGSHGMAVADATCPEHGEHVRLSGHYTTPGADL